MGSGKQTTVTDSPGASADAGLFRFLPDIQVIELLMAIFIFVTIRCLRQGRRQGLVVLPVVGMLPSLLLGIRKDMYEWITSVLDGQGGTFLFRGPWFTNLHCVVTADPRNLDHLLKVKFPNFPKGEYFRGTVCDLVGDGIFSADDEIWRRQRKTASLEFHSAEFRAVPRRARPLEAPPGARRGRSPARADRPPRRAPEAHVRQRVHDSLRDRPGLPAPGATGDTICQGLRGRDPGNSHPVHHAYGHMEVAALLRPRERGMAKEVHRCRRRVRLRGDPDQEGGALVRGADEYGKIRPADGVHDVGEGGARKRSNRILRSN
ncbi:hypothetical protein B296_00054296 [Ensete ventricosum]|uniref:Cytochrome P450 n=1 Tax=Ensete ventricosum TaxID=4639 RepID=A0A426X2X8_ENSVE|nr:hypothetical protein B296_00054296 [Ensete ventricosum]